MTRENRHRLARVVRDPRGDVVEMALRICAEADPDLDVDVELLKVDALSDGLRTRGFQREDPEAAAAALAGYLGGELGFIGDVDTYHDPANGLLSQVLERRRGLPITLSVLYVGIAQRLGCRAYPIALPGHVVAGIGKDLPPIVIDAFTGGQRLSEDDVALLVARGSAGRMPFHRAMLRPTPTAAIAHRLLDNLNRDFRALSDPSSALWVVELMQMLPGATTELHRERGDLLMALGRWDHAALALDDYLEHNEDALDFEEVQIRARRARARMN